MLQAPAPLPRIRLLPAAVVNRIAAGEVIERPAAVVKELVENALDAGARHVSIALASGGIARIEVADDGCGMDPESLALAIERHATSKLMDDGLVRISTLGFRGEALPAIGAAARLAITSRPWGSDCAWMIRLEGGLSGPPVPAAGPPGTLVSVTDLFYATPARRRFLKSPRAEMDAIETTLRRLAVAAPAVAFRLEHEGRMLLERPAEDRLARVGGLLGAEIVPALIGFVAERGHLHLEGFVAAPSVHRASAAAQSFVVNGRPVIDPLLRLALRIAFRDVVPAGRYGVAALYLTLPTEAVDVNVHPAKTEIRFRDTEAVRALIIGAVGRALARPAGHSVPRPRLALRPPQEVRPLPASAPWGFAEAPLPLASAARAEAEAALEPEHPLGAAVAQLLETYILAVTADGALIVVDQHAAHERLTEEALKATYAEGGVPSQSLLIPAVVDLPPSAAARLVAKGPELASFGLEIEPFGPGAVLVRAMPAVLGSPEPGPLVLDLAEQLSEEGEATALADRLDAIIARFACHGSIRAGRRLTQAEMDALLRRMENTPRAATCSHGRPTFLRFTRTDLERLFGRR